MDLLTMTYTTKDWADICTFVAGCILLIGIIFTLISLEDHNKKIWIITGVLYAASIFFFFIPNIAGNNTHYIKKYYISDEAKIDILTKDAYKYNYKDKILTVYIEGE